MKQSPKKPKKRKTFKRVIIVNNISYERFREFYKSLMSRCKKVLLRQFLNFKTKVSFAIEVIY